MSDYNQKRGIVVIGSGGHAASVIDVLNNLSQWKIHGIISVEFKKNETFQGIPIIGDDTILMTLIQQQYSFVIGIGQILSSNTRYKIYNQLIDLDAELPSIIAPSAYISKKVLIGKGTMAFHRVIVNANAQVGDNCILNNNCLIEHDTIIGSHTHISTGAIINGNVNIGDHCFIGSGSVVANNVKISNRVILGAGSVVVKHINEAGVYFGNPARKKE